MWPDLFSKKVKPAPKAPYIGVEKLFRREHKMGWAKYCEDNLSIYNDRIFMAQVKPIVYRLPQVENVRVVNREQPLEVKNKLVPGNSRCGLELSFEATPDKKTVMKLRLNGWWWSKARSCWCNTNTTDNRKYVRTTFSGCPFHLTAVT